MDITRAFTVTPYQTLDAQAVSGVWDMYETAFAPLKVVAAQRHLMTHAEFWDLVSDPRVTKYVAADQDGRVLGMSTLTNDLDAVPLIEPAWFAHHFPGPYHDARIWYLGLACVADIRSITGGLVFSSLIQQMAIPARDTRGMVFMDFATANRLRLLSGIRRTVLRLDPEHTFQPYDQQEFWGFDFARGAHQ